MPPDVEGDRNQETVDIPRVPVADQPQEIESNVAAASVQYQAQQELNQPQQDARGQQQQPSQQQGQQRQENEQQRQHSTGAVEDLSRWQRLSTSLARLSHFKPAYNDDTFDPNSGERIGRRQSTDGAGRKLSMEGGDDQSTWQRLSTSLTRLSHFRPSIHLNRHNEGPDDPAGRAHHSFTGGFHIRDNLEKAQASVTRRWQEFDQRRSSTRAKGMARIALRFVRTLTTPKAMDILSVQDWEGLSKTFKDTRNPMPKAFNAAGVAAAMPEADVEDPQGGDVVSEGSEEEEDEQPLSPMPKSAIKHSQALMFVFESKAGCLASYTWGWGFLINRLATKPDGSAVWSPPCLFKVQSMAVGLTFGISNRGSVYAFSSADTVRLHMYGRPVLGLDFNVVMDYLQSVYEGKTYYQRPQAPRLTFLGDKSGAQLVAQYDVIDGSMIDVSVKMGAIYTSEDLHKRLYGPHLSPEEILFDSQTPQPREFARLYAYLQQVADESSI